VRRSSAPNCTETSALYSWVGSSCARRSFCIDNKPFCSHHVGFFLIYVGVQFAPTKSLLGRSVPLAAVCNNGGQYMRLLVPRMPSYGVLQHSPFLLCYPKTHTRDRVGLDDNDQCKCNTVVYNLISACDACQGSSWIACVDQLSFFRLPAFQSIRRLFHQLLRVDI
jgi:hypothetical protein